MTNPSGSSGSSVQVSIPYGTYTSSISQYDADMKAIGAAQTEANTRGTCSSVGLPKKSIIVDINNTQFIGGDNVVNIVVIDKYSLTPPLITTNNTNVHDILIEDDSDTMKIEMSTSSLSCFVNVTSYPYFSELQLNTGSPITFTGIPKATERIYIHFRNI